MTDKALSGQDPRSIWWEGAYSTGKSYVALTVKFILDATDEEVIAYFDDFGLRQDLPDQYSVICLNVKGIAFGKYPQNNQGVNTNALPLAPRPGLHFLL